MAANDWQTRGTSTFAGGVSDSIYGVSAYAYMDNYAGVNTGAKKAWFFFDNEVVCLGSGINSLLHTRLLHPPQSTSVCDDKNILLSHQTSSKRPIKKGEFSYDSPDWVLHITESDISL